MLPICAITQHHAIVSILFHDDEKIKIYRLNEMNERFLTRYTWFTYKEEKFCFNEVNQCKV